MCVQTSGPVTDEAWYADHLVTEETQAKVTSIFLDLVCLFILLLLLSSAISLGFTIFGWDFCICDHFLIQPLQGSHAPWVSLNLLEFRISLSRPLKLLEKWKFAYSPWKLLENWASLVSKNLILDFQTGLYSFSCTLFSIEKFSSATAER